MTDNVTIAIVAASVAAFGSICVLAAAVFAMISNNKRLDDLRAGLKDLMEEFRGFKDVINGKLSSIDNKLGNIWDKVNK